MKKTLVITALLTVLSSAVFASEGESTTAKASTEVRKSETQVFNLVYKGATSERVDVRIVDENDNILFSESIKNLNAFARPYNLSQLPEGTYTIKVTDSNGTKVHEIHNYKNPAKVVEKSLHFVRLTKVTDGKYQLTIGNQGVNDAQIEIYDNNQNLLYRNTELLNGNYAKVYNLQQVDAKTVSIEINGQIKTFDL